jgi:site-specific DNA recombinase
VVLPERYDDGGYTGGNTERPGLQRLLADIEAGRIDCVVVYKVDRLSRSLLDFARLVQTFETRKVSFVSVTQQFNTVSSMGRLILNVLLSFAQFEREIIGERTRDKIAATRRKGKWPCGVTRVSCRSPAQRVSRAGSAGATTAREHAQSLRCQRQRVRAQRGRAV